MIIIIIKKIIITEKEESKDVLVWGRWQSRLSTIVVYVDHKIHNNNNIMNTIMLRVICDICCMILMQ